jgi:hypothetical protein
MRDQNADKFLPTLPNNEWHPNVLPTLSEVLWTLALVPLTYLFIAGFLCL